jgi:hypothetical protein
VLIYLTLHSKSNHGIGVDNGSSAILFGWRFTPTLVAVLFTQMTVILFEDVKRTEPFARLAKAPLGGAKAYGTLLQTPRAWWSIFIDACFRRKHIGHTSWSLICAALINVLALLAISPLSSALLTSEEALVPKAVEFTRIVPRPNVKIPMVPNRETYYRTINAVFRNVSTSAWLNDTSLSFPFWPTAEQAQFGPTLESSFGAWQTNTTTLKFNYECEEMKLESADMTLKQYSGIYSTQRYGPFNGTQPMVTFVLTSSVGCRYEFSVHPYIDLAIAGGVTWSNASTFYLPSSSDFLFLGGRPLTGGVNPTSLFARVNASEQCNGRDIITMNTPWTLPLVYTPGMPMSIPENQTYERSPRFRMRGLLCSPEYLMANQSLKAHTSKGSRQILETSSGFQRAYQKVPESFIDVSQFQVSSTQNDWKTYIDESSMYVLPTIEEGSGSKAGFSGMAPILGAPSNFNVTAMLDDPEIAQRAAFIKGRFFMETLRGVFDNRDFVNTDVTIGEATMIENRVVVLTEIGFTLASLFFLCAALLILVFWTSRLFRRPLNLRSDPASTIGLSLLLDQRNGGLSAFRRMHHASRVDLYTALQKENYLTSNNVLMKGDNNTGRTTPFPDLHWQQTANIAPTDAPIKVDAKPNWRPRVIHVRMLLGLGLVLTSVMVAILTMNAFSARSLLSQHAFIYEANISKLGFSFSTFAPISIAPTVVSIVVGLWWDQLDSTWRMLQPFISMSRGPVSISDGAGLTYRSKSWVGAAFKSGRQKHWVLFMIAIGTVMAQVLTVSMSALFERQSHTATHPVSFQRSLELRQVPVVTVGDNNQGSSTDPVIGGLEQFYNNPTENWLYGAGIQQSFNGSQLPWTSDGWSFLPVNLSSISDKVGKPTSKSDNVDDTTSTARNASMVTSAIRARLNCTIIEEIANVSLWVTHEDYSNQSSSFASDDFAQLNGTGKLDLYRLSDYIFNGTDSLTTTMSSSKSARCCQNGSIDDPKRSVLGYWSPVRTKKFEYWPYENRSWPLPIVIKWVVGRSIAARSPRGSYNQILYKELPRMQAARCRPVIETAEASITVDVHTGDVYSATIVNLPSAAEEAWSSVFTRHNESDNYIRQSGSGPVQNITTSYGILFLSALLGLADRDHTVGGSFVEDLNENAFVFRDPQNGLNMDLMTYSMYTLADKNPEALLDFTTLTRHADHTFQTFFQQFINSELSPSKGGYVYQPINDNGMEFLGPPVDENGTLIAEKQFPVRNTNRTVEASISQRIRVLHINAVATYLSTAILIWLIFTTFIVICVQRQYTRFMNRDVQLIADMLVLVAGSDNLLELIEEKGVELKRNKDIKTMLGWFRDRDGEVRWGVEVVGGGNAVDWVDAPKQGFHVPNKTSKSASSMFAWRPWRRN